MYSTKTVIHVTGASANQLKYWVRRGIVFPISTGKNYFFEFREIIKIKMIVGLKAKGLSLQKIRQGINNLINVLPHKEKSLSNLVIHTDGYDMIVNERGRYFSAITKQRYFVFDTAEIKLLTIEANSQPNDIVRASIKA
jgi:DNA-binding transcriptional MerR regulator